MAKKKIEETPAVEETPAKEEFGGEESEVEEKSEDSESEESEAPSEEPQRDLFKIKCSECGKDAEVPFKPTEGRPVYCRDCFMKHRPPRRSFGGGGGGGYGRRY